MKKLQELFWGKEKYNKMIFNYQKNIQELGAELSERIAAKQHLQKELDSKEADIEQRQ